MRIDASIHINWNNVKHYDPAKGVLINPNKTKNTSKGQIAPIVCSAAPRVIKTMTPSMGK